MTRDRLRGVNPPARLDDLWDELRELLDCTLLGFDDRGLETRERLRGVNCRDGLDEGEAERPDVLDVPLPRVEGVEPVTLERLRGTKPPWPEGELPGVAARERVAGALVARRPELVCSIGRLS